MLIIMLIICDWSHASPPLPHEPPPAPQDAWPAFLGSGRAALVSTPWASSSFWMASDMSRSPWRASPEPTRRAWPPSPRRTWAAQPLPHRHPTSLRPRPTLLQAASARAPRASGLPRIWPRLLAVDALGLQLRLDGVRRREVPGALRLDPLVEPRLRGRVVAAHCACRVEGRLPRDVSEFRREERPNSAR
ncbi:unnamed protein product [Prorocentrum cordatum]|uniref:Uncharacterized protein n=1 Tax=Prorocentrum cordatum TaxID=2364126 RepID=A0ABN9QVK4_9DINO|nr:unnamed protein product [Polarella glacialis]